MATRQTTRDKKLEVRVRMYTQGLGDCFLLTFTRGSEKFNMLIDCGVLQGTVDAPQKMSAVVQNIKSETGGSDSTKGRLDLVVATHEHWDHISGFSQAQADFDQIDFDAIWLAWTEDKNNRQASKLKRIQEARREAIKKAKAAKKAEGLKSLFERIDNILHFEGPEEDEEPAGGDEPLAAARRSGKQKAWDYLLKEKDAARSFCRPGQLLEFEGFDGVRVYVLGPPEDEDLLRRSDPRKGTDEVFEKSFALTLEELFCAAVSGVDSSGVPVPRPFEEHIGIREEEARTDPMKYSFFHEQYGFNVGGPQEWRNIDDDWLSLAGELALNLDSDTNNTCLALAIELVDSGKVLLFPGDAQVGNWLSWERLSWMVRDRDGRERTITSQDLLERTVLYKVGHHGSHNATLKAKGLELMNSPDLVAILPVDENMAKNQGWHHMPLKSLLKRLREKTRGRVLRADMDKQDWIRQVEKEVKAFASDTEWNRFRRTLAMSDMYIDHSISG